MAPQSFFTVLIVDDDANMRNIINRMLVRMGNFEILEAPDGERGWDILTTSLVDLVISDWDMPKLSGLDFLRKVRADERLSRMRFILLTGMATRESILEAIEARVTNYIVKPFSQKDFTEIVSKSLGL